MGAEEGAGGAWTLLTGHGHVLVAIARDPTARVRDIAAATQITERTVQAIVADLEASGYITRTRTGRRTCYTIDPDMPFRHPDQNGHLVGPFLAQLAASPDPGPAADPARKTPADLRPAGVGAPA